jgi:hypothetical protein
VRLSRSFALPCAALRAKGRGSNIAVMVIEKRGAERRSPAIHLPGPSLDHRAREMNRRATILTNSLQGGLNDSAANVQR